MNDELQVKLDRYYSYENGTDAWTRYSHRKRVDCIARFIPKVTSGKALDLGCGCGVYSVLLAKNGYDVTGIDINPQSLLQARNWVNEEGLLQQVNFQNADIQELPFPDSSVDLVVASEVLEHLKNPSLALKEIKRVLAPGGRVIITLPNLFSLPWLLRRIITVLKREQLTDDEQQHMRYPFWKSISMLKQSKIKILFISGVCFLPLNLKFVHKHLGGQNGSIWAKARYADDILSRFVPFKYGNSFFLIVGKKI